MSGKRPENSVEAPEPGKTEVLEKDRLGELARELVRTKQEYRGAMEELETSNEELRSTNEEMQSANEELQSTNEELESSREELQSLNEELNTVNSELQVNIRELDDSYQAVTDALDSTRIAMVFLGQRAPRCPFYQGGDPVDQPYRFGRGTTARALFVQSRCRRSLRKGRPGPDKPDTL